jgi:hypothetical protein
VRRSALGDPIVSCKIESNGYVGRNFSLDETLRVALNDKCAVGLWGPYEIRKAAFDLGVKRKLLLDGETTKYKADDRLTRKDQVAINCFHAMANLEQLYPNVGQSPLPG